MLDDTHHGRLPVLANDTLVGARVQCGVLDCPLEGVALWPEQQPKGQAPQPLALHAPRLGPVNRRAVRPAAWRQNKNISMLMRSVRSNEPTQ